MEGYADELGTEVREGMGQMVQPMENDDWDDDDD